MDDRMDSPDTRSGFELSVEFPEFSTEEEMLAGLGMRMNITSSYMSQGATATALLRAAETILASEVREALEARRSPLSGPEDGGVLDALVALNARLLAINTLSEMNMLSQEVSGFSIPGDELG